MADFKLAAVAASMSACDAGESPGEPHPIVAPVRSTWQPVPRGNGTHRTFPPVLKGTAPEKTSGGAASASGLQGALLRDTWASLRQRPPQCMIYFVLPVLANAVFLAEARSARILDRPTFRRLDRVLGRQPVTPAVPVSLAPLLAFLEKGRQCPTEDSFASERRIGTWPRRKRMGFPCRSRSLRTRAN